MKGFARELRLQQGFAMDVRRISATLAVACACLAPVHATAQQDRLAPQARPLSLHIVQPSRSIWAPRQRALPIESDRFQSAGDGSLESWDLEEGGQVSLGRFSVTQIARPRSNLEREPMPMEQRASAVAGAGLRIPF
jgi:hypothetical protein